MNFANFASDRRWAFVIFNACIIAFGGLLVAIRISTLGWTVAGAGLFVLFLVLQAQIVYGFTLAVTGWWILRRGGDPVRINQTLPSDAEPDELPATAIVVPIYNEDVGRVFHSIRVMFESLKNTGKSDAFDIFILSDTSDLNVWVAEEQAWFKLCQQVQGFGRIFYRKRRVTLHHKSGNVADFCRRWGSRYRYLVVLDADSVMTGPTFVRLVSLMEMHPQAGIIQTYSRPVMGQSLFQRINQFSAYAYGPLFAAGANFWQLDNASFYGHNAIIRVEPFMKFCAMPELPPAGKLGTRILSHDTVEAALIRRAGYEVWSDYDLGGSYEEAPPHLPASLQRDRRWCHGNMQHFWFLFSRGLTMSSRVNILIGIMAYAGSPLWLLFLLFSPVLFIGGNLPVQNRFMFFCAMFLLLIPKVLAALRLVSARELRRAAGGTLRVILSTLGETIYSMTLAPILMLFYSQFVWSSYFGGSAGWGRQRRTDETGPSWRECLIVHCAHTVLATAAGVLAAVLLPQMFPWLLLVLFGPILSIPFSRLMASNKLGRGTRRYGLFLVPEEVQPPWELRYIEESSRASTAGISAAENDLADYGLAQAILNPRLNSIHVSLLHERRQVPPRTRRLLDILCNQLLREGPSSLSVQEKRMVLCDAGSVLSLHRKLWSTPSVDWPQWWQNAFDSCL
jgi:membrane glycosyltransferase